MSKDSKSNVRLIKQEPPSLEIHGSTGLRRSGGHVYDEWLNRLGGTKAVSVYREMSDNDPVVGAFIYTVESLVRQVQFYVRPANKSPEAAREAEFVEGCIDDMSHTFSDFLSEVLSMLIYGWSYFEIVYKVRKGASEDPRYRSKYNDKRVGWRKFSMRGQDTLSKWSFDEDGGIKGMYQTAAPKYQLTFIPISKGLLFRTKTNRNNPEGRSLLRNAYRSWYMLRRMQEIEAIGIERDLSGLPILEVPPEIMSPEASSADKTLRASLEKLVQEIKRDEREGMVLPSELDTDGKPTGYKFRLLNSGGRRAVDVDAAIRRYESRVAMSVLAEFLLLGMDKVGSFALASTKTHLFSVALGGILDSITQVFNRFAIARLMEVNGVDPSLWPVLEHGDIEKPELREIANYVASLTGAGILAPDEKLETKLREYANLPLAEDESLSPPPAEADEEEE